MQSDSFVYQSTNFDPRVEMLLFKILLELDFWKLYKIIFQGVMEVEKLEKLKCASKLIESYYSPFQIRCSHYIIVNKFSKFNPRIKILLFFYFCNEWWVVEKCTETLSGNFGSQEISKTKVGTFFMHLAVLTIVIKSA